MKNEMKNIYLNPFKVTLVTLICSASLTFAQTTSLSNIDDGAFLDPPYKKNSLQLRQKFQTRDANFASLRSGLLNPMNEILRVLKNDVLSVVDMQSSVKSQGSRGTCSIFSAAALLETLLISNQQMSKETLDLSEEWLEYVKAAETGGEGSSSPANINYFKRFGMPAETSLPYIGETWEKLEDSDLATERCASLMGRDQKKCLIGHRNPKLLRARDADLLDENSELHDPEFQLARSEATQMKNTQLINSPAYKYVWNEEEVKELLKAGVPVLLDIDFYYGAWNHREGPNHGLERNMEHWSQGLVGYPEVGSLDRKVSLEDPAGHSILVVGYDDDEEMTVEQQMLDGTKKTFTYKGVYYFKNSWGQSNFGVNTKIEGRNLPGYGKITQKYSHESGAFFVWDWRTQDSN